MKQQVNPVVAVLIIVIALVAVWFVYTRVLTGQEAGTIGPPSNVSLPPPPAKSDSMPEMPRTKEADKPAAPDGGTDDTKPAKP